MKSLFTLLGIVLSFYTAQSEAAPLNGGCQGTYRGQKIRFVGTLKKSTDFKSGKGSLYVGGREVARFFEDDLEVSLIRRTFKMENNHGDILQGKVVKLSENKGLVTRLSVPSQRLTITNLPVTCWSK